VWSARFSRFATRFSFSDFPGFFPLGFRGDLSDMGPPQSSDGTAPRRSPAGFWALHRTWWGEVPGNGSHHGAASVNGVLQGGPSAYWNTGGPGERPTEITADHRVP